MHSGTPGLLDETGDQLPCGIWFPHTFLQSCESFLFEPARAALAHHQPHSFALAPSLVYARKKGEHLRVVGAVQVLHELRQSCSSLCGTLPIRESGLQSLIAAVSDSLVRAAEPYDQARDAMTFALIDAALDRAKRETENS